MLLRVDFELISLSKETVNHAEMQQSSEFQHAGINNPTCVHTKTNPKGVSHS